MSYRTSYETPRQFHFAPILWNRCNSCHINFLFVDVDIIIIIVIIILIIVVDDVFVVELRRPVPLHRPNQRRQGNFRFQECNIFSNAIAWSLDKGQKGKGIDAFASLLSQKAFRNKFFDISRRPPYFGIALDGIKVQMDDAIAQSVVFEVGVGIYGVSKKRQRRAREAGKSKQENAILNPQVTWEWLTHSLTLGSQKLRKFAEESLNPARTPVRSRERKEKNLN